MGGKGNAMLRFKKIEQWIGARHEFFKGILVILWVLWAFAQMDHVSFTTENGVSTMEIDRAVNGELVTFYEKILKEAEEKGWAYSAKDYFTDYRRIKEEWHFLKKKYPGTRHLGIGSYGPTSPMGLLQRKIESNRIRGIVSEKDISREAELFSQWERSGGVVGDEAVKEFHGLDFKSKVKKFSKWFLVLYLRSLPFVVLWYLIRMCKCRGILETILAGKRKFVLAILAWPILFWRYPFNVLRLIRVEAELRRTGNLFRHFSLSEKLFVQKIANSEDFKGWLTQYRQQNKGKFQHSLLVALIVTIVFISVAPAFCYHHSNCSGVDPPGYAQVVVKSCDSGVSRVGIGDCADHEYALPETELVLCYREICSRFRIVHMMVSQCFVCCIEHVPLRGFQVSEENFSIT